MIQRSVKVLKNNAVNNERLVNKKSAFFEQNLQSKQIASSLEQLIADQNKMLEKSSKKFGPTQSSDVPKNARSLIGLHHKIGESLEKERRAIKNFLVSDDMYYAYDALLKRSILQNRKLIFELTYYL